MGKEQINVSEVLLGRLFYAYSDLGGHANTILMQLGLDIT